MRRGGVEPACFMVGSTRKTLGTTEPASRDLKPSDRFLRLRRHRTQRRDLPFGVTRPSGAALQGVELNEMR